MITFIIIAYYPLVVLFVEVQGDDCLTLQVSVSIITLYQFVKRSSSLHDSQK